MTKTSSTKVIEGMHAAVVCERLHASGAGVARVGQFDLHVAGALPGAALQIEVDHVSPHAKGERRQAWAHILNTTQPSPHAREPFCPAFGACGGCTWQHLDYAQQLYWKRDIVEQALAHVELPQPISPCIASPHERGYRNQAKYVVEALPNGLRLGGYAPRSHTVVDLSACALVEPPIAAAMPTLATVLSPLAKSLRHVVIRASAKQETLLTLVFGDQQAAHTTLAAATAQRLLRACDGLVGVVANVNEAPGDVIFGENEFSLAGQGFVVDEILGTKVVLSPRAFFQLNRHVAALAYQQVAAFAKALGRVHHLWDVYAGVGTIARVLCQALPELESALCVEIRSAAVADAQSSDATNTRHDRLRFVAADAAVGMPAGSPDPDLVVVNPPRAGCHPSVLARLAKAKPKGVAYLSCNPTTLARDLMVLLDLGYVTQSVQPFDMLPHTPHVETLALLAPR